MEAVEPWQSAGDPAEPRRSSTIPSHGSGLCTERCVSATASGDSDFPCMDFVHSLNGWIVDDDDVWLLDVCGVPACDHDRRKTDFQHEIDPELSG